MISESHERPWRPVTIAEALDWRERELAAREADWQMASTSAGRAEAQLRAAYENMRNVDPAAAEQMRTRMERDFEKIRRDEARTYAQSNDAVARTRSAFDAYRASFTADRLREPATISSQLYRDVFDQARASGVAVVTCEFNLVPPNEASARFHARWGFAEVGRQWLDEGRKQVSLQAAVLTG